VTRIYYNLTLKFKEMKKTISIIPVFLLLSGCFSTKLLTPTQADVDRVTPLFPGYSLNDLNKGKMLFEQHCGNCHGLKNPAARTIEQWKEIVPVMSAKVNKKEGNVVDSNAQELILKYVITMNGAQSKQ
jgi:hypothetical protein